jgi:hypothetical protein
MIKYDFCMIFGQTISGKHFFVFCTNGSQLYAGRDFYHKCLYEVRQLADVYPQNGHTKR